MPAAADPRVGDADARETAEEALRPAAVGDDGPAAAPAASRRGRRVLAWIGVALVVLTAVAASLWAFGTMQPPSAEVRAAYDRAVAARRAPVVGGRFGIPVPGCVCHSPDPVLQVQHATVHIRECTRCHASGR